MRQRTETMLHGLWVFPMLPGHSEHPAELGAQLHLAVRNVRPAGTRSTFSRTKSGG